MIFTNHISRERGGIAVGSSRLFVYRARQLYMNISMLFLFLVKDGMLSTCTGVNAQRFLLCYGYFSIMKNYLTK